MLRLRRIYDYFYIINASLIAGPISDLDGAPNYITDPERPTADTEAITNTEGDDVGDLKESVSKEMEIVDSQGELCHLQRVFNFRLIYQI